MGLRQMVGECDGDRSGTGADVEDVERRRGVGFRLLDLGQDGFDEVLRLGTRDEDRGCDVECDPVELLFAGDVLDGFVAEAPEDEAVVCGLLARSKGAVGVGVQRGARDSEGVQEQQQRIALCAGAKVRRRVELSSGAGEGLAD